MDTLKNSFPIVGAVVTPLLSITFSTLYQTVILAAIGALTGLVVKSLFEYIVKLIKNKKE
jgi:uncharacterized membrane protein